MYDTFAIILVCISLPVFGWGCYLIGRYRALIAELADFMAGKRHNHKTHAAIETGLTSTGTARYLSDIKRDLLYQRRALDTKIEELDAEIKQSLDIAQIALADSLRDPNGYPEK